MRTRIFSYHQDRMVNVSAEENRQKELRSHVMKIMIIKIIMVWNQHK